MPSFQSSFVGVLVGCFSFCGSSAKLSAQSTEIPMPGLVRPITDDLQGTKATELLLSQSTFQPSISSTTIDQPTLPDFKINADRTLAVGFTEFYRELLKHNQGFYWAEPHSGDEIHDHYIQQIRLFSALGVKKLFIEFIRSEDQAVLDRYNKDGSNDYLVKDALQRHGFAPESHFKIIEAAHEQGTEVIALDLYTTEERVKTCNPHWVKVIKAHLDKLQPGEKFAVISGESHAGSQCIKHGVTGVAEELGIPTVSIKLAYNPETSASERYANSINSIAPEVLETVSMPQIRLGSKNGHHYSIILKIQKPFTETKLCFDPVIDVEQPVGVQEKPKQIISQVDYSELKPDKTNQVQTSVAELIPLLLQKNQGILFSNINEPDELQSYLIANTAKIKEYHIKRIYVQMHRQDSLFAKNRYQAYDQLISDANSVGIEVYGLRSQVQPDRQDAWVDFILNSNETLGPSDKFLIITDSLLIPLCQTSASQLVSERLGIPLLEMQSFYPDPQTISQKRYNSAREISEDFAKSNSQDLILLINENSHPFIRVYKALK